MLNTTWRLLIYYSTYFVSIKWASTVMIEDIIPISLYIILIG